VEEDVKARFEDVKSRFDDLDKRIAVTDKRFDDVKYFAGGVSILLGVLAVLAGLNFSNERAWLRESMKDLKEEVGKLEAPAQLEILGTNGQPLGGQEVTAKTGSRPDASGAKYALRYDFIVRNNGAGNTGPMWVKVYTRAGIALINASSDESSFKYEDLITPTHLVPSELPGKVSIQEWLSLATNTLPPPGKYPILMKHYYGKGKVATTSFTLVIERN